MNLLGILGFILVLVVVFAIAKFILKLTGKIISIIMAILIVGGLLLLLWIVF